MDAFVPFTPRLEKVDRFIRKLLEHLSEHVVYHSAAHTLDPECGVVAVASRLAVLESVTDVDRELLCVAAYFHDVGFLTGEPDGHEERSAARAREELPALGFSDTEVAVICEIILVTQMGCKPETLLQEIIKDADVDNLGRDDFFERSELLRQEFGVASKQEWYGQTRVFLEEHMWRTASQKKLRGIQKAKNLQNVKKLLASLDD